MAIEGAGLKQAAVEQGSIYFETASRSRCLNILTHLVRNTEDMAYVSGPPRSGKSCFAARLGKELGGDFLVVQVAAAAGVDPMSAAFRALAIDPEGVGWLDCLHAAIEARPTLVIVDDADKLSPESQHRVLELHDEGVRVILLGMDPVPAVLEEEVSRVGLPPLTEQETRDYLGFLGRRAGVSVATVAAARMHKACEGWPGLLADQMATGETPGDAGAAKPVSSGRWFPVAMLMLVLALAGWFKDELTQMVAGESPVKAPAAGSPAPAEPEAAAIQQPEEAELAAAPVADISTDTIDHPGDIATQSPEQEGEAQQAAATELKAAADEALAGAEEAGDGQGQAVSEPSVVPASQIAVLGGSEADAESGSSPGRNGGMAWLRAQNAKAYTLQLVAAHEREAIYGFIASHSLPGVYAVFVRDLSGKPWYSLVMGIYPDRESAMDARASLPDSLQGDGVWVRTFGSIQESLSDL